MSAIAAAIGVGTAVYGARQSKKAGQAQAAQAQKGIDAQTAMFNRQTELNEPFRQAGITGQNRYMELMGLGGNTGAQGFGKYAKDPTMADLEFDPGYQFRLSEGLKGVENTAAARGGLISGKALKAAGRYNQGFASNEYGNAFERYQTNRANQLNPLATLMGAGQTATGAMSNAAGQQGRDLAAGMSDIGNAQAAGRMGQANALSAGVGQGMNYYQNNRLMNIAASRAPASTSGFRTSWDSNWG